MALIAIVRPAKNKSARKPIKRAMPHCLARHCRCAESYIAAEPKYILNFPDATLARRDLGLSAYTLDITPLHDTSCATVR